MKYIDLEQWPRKEHFAFFTGAAFPFYNVTLELDVTHLRAFVKAQGLSFYYTLIYATLAVMNDLPDFHYRIFNGQIIQHDRLHPSFVTFQTDTHLLKITDMSLEGTLEDFCRAAEAKVAAQTTYFPTAEQEGRNDMVYFSCTPWFTFTSLINEMDGNPDDSIPRITWAKYTERNGRLILPYAVQLNHRLLDGWHVGQLITNLQCYIDQLH